MNQVKRYRWTERPGLKMRAFTAYEMPGGGYLQIEHLLNGDRGRRFSADSGYIPGRNAVTGRRVDEVSLFEVAQAEEEVMKGCRLYRWLERSGHTVRAFTAYGMPEAQDSIDEVLDKDTPPDH